jgi:TonB-dependent receptor
MNRSVRKALFPSVLLTLATLPATALAQDQAQDADNQEDLVLEEVVVTGMRVSAASMRDAKKNSENITDSIYAEDMGKMPDENIAEAMQRITGISISRANGEGTEVTIRGVDPSLNQVTMNGVRLTNGGDDNGVDFSMMSADILRAIEVVKSPSANHDEGSLGGTVNLKTFKPLDMKQRRITATIQLQQDELADETDPVLKAAYTNQFGDGRFGLAVSTYWDERTTREDYFRAYNWKVWSGVTATSYQTGEDLGKINSHEFIGLEPGIRLRERVRYGGTATLEFRPSDVSSLWLDLSYSLLNEDYMAHQTRMTGLRTGNIWDEESGSSFYASANASKGTGNILSRDQEMETETTTIGLNYERDIGDWTLLAKLGTSDTEQAWLKNHRVNFKPKGPISINWLNENGGFNVIPTMTWHTDSGFWDLDAARLFQLYDDSRSVKDEYDSVSVDLNRAMNGGFFSGIAFGAKYWESNRYRSQTTGNTRFTTDENGDQIFLADFTLPFPVNDFFAGVANNVIDGWPIPDFDAIYDTYLPNGFDGPIDDANTYTIKTDATAFYIKAEFSAFDDRLLGDFGVRYVQTNVSSIGHRGANFPVSGPEPWNISFPVNLKNDYSNTLPSFNARWILSEDMLLRFSVAKVMARPRFSELRPGVSVKASNPNLPQASGGNPMLDPTEATQYDISWEWYFGDSGLLSVAGFYKDLESFIFVSTDEVTYDCPEGIVPENCALLVDVPTTMPINGKGGYVYGFELAYQQHFDFLPGFLSDFGGIFNYTYADSDATYVSEDTANAEYFDGFPFLNTSRDTFNTTLYWERGGHTVRLAYNYRSESLWRAVHLNSSIWQDTRQSLDFSAIFKLTRYMNLTLAANNLTDEYNRRFTTRTVAEKGLHGEGNVLDGSAPQWRTENIGHIGRTYRIGLNFRF